MVAEQEGELVWEKIREFLQQFAFASRYGEARQAEGEGHGVRASPAGG